MELIRATLSHRAEWIRLRTALYGPGPHAEEVAQLLAHPDYDAFLALDRDGRAIGLLELSLRNLCEDRVAGPVGFVEGLFLDPDVRSQGLGQVLMEHAEAWSRARGAVELGTDSELANTRAHAFYKRLGFRELGRTVRFARPLEGQAEGR